ncbi:MAG: c-type cytochrome [Fuerstiella sp.]
MPATEHFFRNQKKLHLVFAISCVVLLASVVAMMVEDYADPWRSYQATNFKLQAAAKKVEISRMKTSEFEANRESLEKQQRENSKSLAELADLKLQVDKERDAGIRKVESLELRLKNENALRDEERAHYDLAIRDNLSDDVKVSLMKNYEKAEAVCQKITLDLETAKADLALVGSPSTAEDEETAEKLKSLQELVKKDVELKKSLAKLEADLVLAEGALEKIDPQGGFMKLKRSFMELPIVDGFNGPIKVTQDWLPELHQTLGMTEIARFDRCRTCHMNMDRTAPGNLPAFPHGEASDPEDVSTWVAENKFPHPFTTHPNHELFVTSSSPHPVATFGCTACHDGQGSGVNFGNAEHTPNDPHVAEDWHHEYGYHPNHFWEYPMQPERFQESTCLKCHHDVTELGVHPKFGASAPKVFDGFTLLGKYGCFGCHEIHGFDGGKSIGPDVRLEPQTAEQEQRVADDPTQVAGKYRKVGPGLRHIAAKAVPGFIEYWTEVPGRFRPSTKMPQFFNLTNQQDDLAQAFEAVELAGIAKVLLADSEPIDLLKPAAEYQPDVARGEQLFSERGCLACHQHDAVPGTTAEFGPNISDIHRKASRNADNKDFSDWLYTWIKEPSRYHARTRMPNLYLDVYSQDGADIDPAADITAFLLSRGDQEDFASKVVDPLTLPLLNEGEENEISPLDELVTLFLRKSRFSDEAVAKILKDRSLGQSADKFAGDERVLATADGSAVTDENEWNDRKLEYIGRRTISRYGCYACHDIPGYEDARPIGVALQDWGRKDTSKLGLEHIEEFLHHHGEPDNSSTRDRVEQAMKDAESGVDGGEALKNELTQAFFYDSLLHHGRAGFLWQKLRGPRTYDYLKTETKGYDERLRMPKFPLKEQEIEAIATFVLGLVAEPPADQYVYTPNERDKNRIEGEFLLAKYNCTGCHMVELPKVTFGVDLEEDVFPTVLSDADHQKGLELFLKIRKPKPALTGAKQKFIIDGEEVDLPLASFHGIKMVEPDAEEEDPSFRESGFDTWETLDFGNSEDPMRVLASSRITVTDAKMVDYQPSRGGSFAEWLVSFLSDTTMGGNRNLAWQASPPPLYQEGVKVQTPWLYQFLLEPEKIRYTTVLRMPKFSLSLKEAQTLANYFAAVDDAEFPYQELVPTDADYLARRQADLEAEGLLAKNEQYLAECWDSVNGPLCIKCHSVGARKFKVSDPKKDIQGPNLNRVQNRLRADWVQLWLYNPKWITPYTSMPVNFPHNNSSQFPDLFKGDPEAQVTGTRDALFNYSRLLEDVGPTVYAPPQAEPAAGDAAGEE